MAEVEIPDELPRWATELQFSELTENYNVIEPTESKKNVGWSPFEPPARNYVNWLHLKAYEWLNYYNYRLNTLEKVTDGNGADLFSEQLSLITLWAVDKVTPANFLYAMGYKGTTSHTLNVIDSNVLTLGSQDADGSQIISGGTASNIIVVGKMRLGL